MLIADVGNISSESESFCLMAGENGAAEIMDCGQLAAGPERAVCGTVLFVCRPPEEMPADLMF